VKIRTTANPQLEHDADHSEFDRSLRASIVHLTKEPSIFYQIRKDLLPGYAKQLQMSVIASYPEKNAEKVTVSRNGVEKEEYELIYTRRGSSITVKFEEDEKWIRYKFDLPVKLNPASSTKNRLIGEPRYANLKIPRSRSEQTQVI
jgi:hypothetical protein